jgi:hypothetical protein
MSESPGLPSPDRELKMREEAQELRMEQARIMAELDEPKVWRLPLEGGLYWARKNNVPAAVWLHKYFVRHRRFLVAGELLLWGAGAIKALFLIRRIS